MEPIFGIVTKTLDDDTQPIIFANMDVVGIIGPSLGADPTVFPLNTPVILNSTDTSMTSKMGSAQGFILDALRGINDQLGDYQRAAQVIYVRTDYGVNADPAIANQLTIAKITGDSVAGTGINAFKLAAEMCHAIPRLILIPGYTGYLATGVATIVPGTAGAGYTPNQSYPLTFSGGGSGASVVQATGHVVANQDGTLGTPVIDTPGAWYTSTPTIAIASPGTGAGKTQATFTATTATLANPIVAGLPSVLSSLIAHAVVESSGTSFANDEAWRQTIDSQRIIPISGGVKVSDVVTGDIVVRPLAPRVVGAMIRVDFQHSGAPFNSAANQPIYGIVGPARSLSFSISDGANEGQELLAVNVGILVQGELGNDFAIAQAGYIFIGTDNAGDDEEFRFYNVTRGRDYINLALIRTLRYFLGRFNITIQTVNAVMNTMKNELRDLQANDNLLGFDVRFKGSVNSADEIRKGNITINFAAEEPTVLRKITTQGTRYKPAIDQLISQLEGALAIAA